MNAKQATRVSDDLCRGGLEVGARADCHNASQ
jgi:hypothetical protein